MSGRFLTRLAGGPPIVCDGGTGTEKARTGLSAREVHRAFVAAGAELVVADSLGAPSAEALVEAVSVAREAGAGFVAASLGPGPRDRRALALAARDAGADVLFAETLLSLEDARASLDAARAAGLPVAVTFALDGAGVGYGGLSAREIAAWAREARPDAVGLNCGVGPAPVLDAAGALAGIPVPLSLRPAASAPGHPVTSPEALAAFARSARALGARLIGGCCGATPSHLAAVAGALRGDG